MNIAIYTLTSALHDEQSIEAATREFLGSLDVEFILRGSDYSDYGSHTLDLIYVRTGGTEGILRPLLPQLRRQSDRPLLLLTSGLSNSLAASMEILSYLNQQGIGGEIIHGSADYVNRRIRLLAQAAAARRQLQGCRLGIVGQPSDWLISSTADYQRVQTALGIQLIDIPMEELQAIVAGTPDEMPAETTENAAIRASLPGAQRIYRALQTLVARHQLQGFTLRCFDLLTSLHNTGCLALAKLNADGIIAGCEGDVPAMLSMALARSVTGLSGFQANPAHINPETGEVLFAHCTIPLNMVERYELDPHFESGIGVGIRGYMPTGDVTVFKVSGDLSRHFIAEGQLLRCQAEPNLCRTQLLIRLDDARQTADFLTRPIGNHHIILPGRQRQVLEEILK